MGWREDAEAEIADLKPHFVAKHEWSPRVVQHEGKDVLDVLLSFRSARLEGQRFLLRLRYLPDWQIAGRREAFVDPEEPGSEGVKHWPRGFGAVKPDHNPPCICLRGVWGYHSVLHTDRPMGDSTLLNFLLELQKVLDR